jgi:hypothetical protein
MLIRKSPRRALMILMTATLALAACNVGATPAPTIDANAINTAALGTAMAQISAQQTMTAFAAPSATSLPTNAPVSLTSVSLPTASGALPTAGGILPTVSFNSTPNTTPLAGFTSVAGSPIAPTSAGIIGDTKAGCNDGAFVGETLPDKSVIGAGKDFTKAWEIKNTGTCPWDDGYVFAFQPDLSSPGIEGYDITINERNEFTKTNHSQSFVVKLTAPKTPGEYKGYWKLKSDDGTYFGPLVYFHIVVK